MKAFFAKRISTDTSVLLNSLESMVEQHIHLTIKTIQNLPPDVLLKSSASGGWSIAQCIEHLNTYGNYYLPAIENAMKSKAHEIPQPTFKNSRFGQYFTYMMEPQNRGKIKATKPHTPSRNLNAPSVIAEFIRQQEVLLLQLRNAQYVNLQKLHVPISISKLIKLPLGDVFQFIVAHDARHMAQAMRNLNK